MRRPGKRYLTVSAVLAGAACGGDGPGPSAGDPPAVVITAPAPGIVVQGTITLVANASDDERVAAVRFYVDGTPIGADDTDPPYAVLWDTRGTAEGWRNLTARARDIGGLVTNSDPVSVHVLNEPASIELTVTVGGGGTDPDGFSVLVDGMFIGSLDGPGTMTIGGLAAGDHHVELGGVSLWCPPIDPVGVTLAGGSVTPLTIPLDCAAGPGGRLILRGRGESGLELTWLPVASGIVERLFQGVGSAGVSANGERLALIADRILLVSGIDRADQTPVATLPFMSADPRWSPDGSTIAFHTTANGNDIHLIDPDGSNERAFFAEPTAASRGFPAWSPGGGLTYVLYNTLADGIPEIASIWMANAAGGEETFFADGHSPAWSPDGSSLALARPKPGGGSNIYVVSADGSTERQLTDGANDSHPVWSPDGVWIAYSRDAAGGRRELWVVRAADGSDARKFHDHYEEVRATGWIAGD